MQIREKKKIHEESSHSCLIYVSPKMPEYLCCLVSGSSYCWPRLGVPASLLSCTKVCSSLDPSGCWDMGPFLPSTESVSCPSVPFLVAFTEGSDEWGIVCCSPENLDAPHKLPPFADIHVHHDWTLHWHASVHQISRSLLPPIAWLTAKNATLKMLSSTIESLLCAAIASIVWPSLPFFQEYCVWKACETSSPALPSRLFWWFLFNAWVSLWSSF